MNKARTVPYTMISIILFCVLPACTYYVKINDILVKMPFIYPKSCKTNHLQSTLCAQYFLETKTAQIVHRNYNQFKKKVQRIYIIVDQPIIKNLIARVLHTRKVSDPTNINELLYNPVFASIYIPPEYTKVMTTQEILVVLGHELTHVILTKYSHRPDVEVLCDVGSYMLLRSTFNMTKDDYLRHYVNAFSKVVKLHLKTKKTHLQLIKYIPLKVRERMSTVIRKINALKE